MTSYTEMMVQIEELKRKAEKTRREELSKVIKAIKKQIGDYGITAADLGLSPKAPTKQGERSRGAAIGKQKRRVKNLKVGSKVAPKYRDDKGNTWTGRGKQPKWLVSAIAMGAKLESFRIS